MHCDTLQIFTQGQKGEQGARVRGGILGLGLLIGGATFSVGWEQGCRKAENLSYFSSIFGAMYVSTG